MTPLVSRLALIDAAQHSIDAQYYIWHDDTSGLLLLDALLRAAERGVRVRPLLDDNGVPGLDNIMAAFNAQDNHELDAMLNWARDAGMGALLALALLKALALALCLASGWRGGAAFPLLFIGAAAGAATLVLIPQIPVTVALVAGMSAALTVGMGRPVPAMLIAVLLIGPAALGSLCVGSLVGWAASSLAPAPKLH